MVIKTLWYGCKDRKTASGTEERVQKQIHTYIDAGFTSKAPVQRTGGDGLQNNWCYGNWCLYIFVVYVYVHVCVGGACVRARVRGVHVCVWGCVSVCGCLCAGV